MAESIHVSEDELRKIDLRKYEANYSETGLWEKIRQQAAAIGVRLIYEALQLYYVTKAPHCPSMVKAGIYGALGYLISPIDLIADMIPGIGYTDDAAVIALALVLAQAYITDNIRQQARDRIAQFLGEEYVSNLA